MLIAHECYSDGTYISITLIRYAYERGCLMCELCLASKVKKFCFYQAYYLSLPVTTFILKGFAKVHNLLNG